MISSPELSGNRTLRANVHLSFFSSLLQFILAGNEDDIILSPEFEYKKKEKEKIKKSAAPINKHPYSY